MRTLLSAMAALELGARARGNGLTWFMPCRIPVDGKLVDSIEIFALAPVMTR